MVSRLLPQRNLGIVFSICLLTVCFLHTQGYGQTVGGDEEVTPVGETPPSSDSGDPNPTEDPQVVPEGEEPEAPEPTNEDLICGTLEGSSNISCPRKTAVNCSDKTKCDAPDPAGNRRCVSGAINPLHKPVERFVSKTGKIGPVPRQVNEGAATAFVKSEQLCFQEFTCAFYCKVEKGKNPICVRGTEISKFTVYKYEEARDKTCEDGKIATGENGNVTARPLK